MARRIEKLVAITTDTSVIRGEPRRSRSGNAQALLTPEQFAEAAGVSVYTVRVWMRQGLIASLPVGVTGRVRRIPAREIERITTGHGNGTTPPLHEQG